MIVVVLSDSLVPTQALEPTILLKPTTWDDFRYKTQFVVTYAGPDGALPVELGYVKILARSYPSEAEHGARWTRYEMPAVSRGLDGNEFCSLGQDAWYYKQIALLPSDARQELLRALCDITVELTPPATWWRTADGFTTALLRHSTSHTARLHAPLLVQGREPTAESIAQIHFSLSKIAGPRGVEEFDVSFNGDLHVPGRLNVVVGRNGVGKTALLTGIAMWFDSQLASNWQTYRPVFSRVLVLSHNPFDSSFELGDPIAGNVRFIGEFNQPKPEKLQKLIRQLRSVDLTADELPAAVNATFQTSAELLAAIDPRQWSEPPADQLIALGDKPEWAAFLGQALDDAELVKKVLENPAKAIRKFSAGQRSLLNIWASLFTELAPQSLLLIDEPENFLHPSLIARFARSLNDLLASRKSFAIAATHSAILVQETPAKFVSILEREGNTTTQRQPDFETFGESMDNLTERLFETDFTSSHWKAVLKNCAMAPQGTHTEIERDLGRALPLTARAYYLYQRQLSRRGSE